MLESRNCYGYGTWGQYKKGYEWRIIGKSGDPWDTYASGYTYRFKCVAYLMCLLHLCRNRYWRAKCGKITTFKSTGINGGY